MHTSILFIALLLGWLYLPAQSVADSALHDTTGLSLPAHTDSLAASPAPEPVLLLHFDSILYNHHPFIKFTNPVRNPYIEREWSGKEPFFYLSIGLILFFAFIKNGFGRYLQDLFRSFFRTTLKQRQVKEQMMQAPLPSLLLNLLFFLSGALFIFLLLHYFNLGGQYPFWLLLLYCIAGLAVIYFVKFTALKIFGWLLGLSQVTDTYIFIVFSGNKIIGILLLPFIVLLSFTVGLMQETTFTLSMIVLGGLILYRFFLSYISVQKLISINLFHFLLYVCAFEVAPLLLINKLLVMFLRDNV